MMRDEGFDRSVLRSQLNILNLCLFVKNSQTYLCLFVVWIALSEYLPEVNI